MGREGVLGTKTRTARNPSLRTFAHPLLLLPLHSPPFFTSSSSSSTPRHPISSPLSCAADITASSRLLFLPVVLFLSPTPLVNRPWDVPDWSLSGNNLGSVRVVINQSASRALTLEAHPCVLFLLALRSIDVSGKLSR